MVNMGIFTVVRDILYAGILSVLKRLGIRLSPEMSRHVALDGIGSMDYGCGGDPERLHCYCEAMMDLDGGIYPRCCQCGDLKGKDHLDYSDDGSYEENHE